jgi:hypothetical protein
MTKINITPKRSNPSAFSRLSNEQKLSLIKDDLLEAKENYRNHFASNSWAEDDFKVLKHLRELYYEAQDAYCIAIRKWG